MKWHNIQRAYRDVPEKLREMQPHEVLQVSEHASVGEVKVAYRRLVKIYHPDKSHEFVQASNAEVIKIINAAYETLTKKADSDA